MEPQDSEKVVLRAKKVILHLFAGERAQEWLELQDHGCEVIALDVMHGKDQDIHNPVLWAFLVSLAKQGSLAVILGGPPCRSVSRLRFRRPGPRPLRDRHEHRFGLPHLSAGEQRLADHDAALVLKQVGLYHMARRDLEVARDPTGFPLESPADPVSMAAESQVPSFWTWPELRGLEMEENMAMVTFDQGAMGHKKRKPTTIMTNLPHIKDLHNLLAKKMKDEALPDSVEESIAQSKSWALWAPGLRAAIKKAIQIYLENFVEVKPKVAAMKAKEVEGWKKHFALGHRPFRRDCRLCIEETGSQKPHRRRSMEDRMSSAWSVSVDIAGPLTHTVDLVTKRPVKYALMAVAVVPDYTQEIKAVKDGDGLHDQGEQGPSFGISGWNIGGPVEHVGRQEAHAIP